MRRLDPFCLPRPSVLGTEENHFRRNADRYLLRGFGLDRQTDRRVYPRSKLIAVHAGGRQTLARHGELAAAADAADIPRPLLQQLPEDGKIRLMVWRPLLIGAICCWALRYFSWHVYRLLFIL